MPPLPTFNHIQFGDGLTVTDLGGNEIRVDAGGGAESFSLEVSDGSTDVDPATLITVGSGLTLTNPAPGEAHLEATGDGSGIQFDTDNEGGYLQVTVNDLLEADSDVLGFTSMSAPGTTFNNTSGTTWHTLPLDLLTGSHRATLDGSDFLQVPATREYRVTAFFTSIQNSGVTVTVDADVCDDLGNSIHTLLSNVTMLNGGFQTPSFSNVPITLDSSRSYTLRVRYHTTPSGSSTITINGGFLRVSSLGEGTVGMWLRSTVFGGLKITSDNADRATILIDAGGAVDDSVGALDNFNGGNLLLGATDFMLVVTPGGVQWNMDDGDFEVHAGGELYGQFDDQWEYYIGEDISLFAGESAVGGQIQMYAQAGSGSDGGMFIGLDGDFEIAASSFSFDSGQVFMNTVEVFNDVILSGIPSSAPVDPDMLWRDGSGFVRIT